MVVIQTTSLIYDRSAGKLAVAGGTSPRGTERRSPVVDLQAERTRIGAFIAANA